MGGGDRGERRARAAGGCLGLRRPGVGGVYTEMGCWPHSDMSCVVTIADAIATANIGGTTHSSAGCDINSMNTGRIAAAVATAKGAD